MSAEGKAYSEGLHWLPDIGYLFPMKVHYRTCELILATKREKWYEGAYDMINPSDIYIGFQAIVTTCLGKNTGGWRSKLGGNSIVGLKGLLFVAMTGLSVPESPPDPSAPFVFSCVKCDGYGTLPDPVT